MGCSDSKDSPPADGAGGTQGASAGGTGGTADTGGTAGTGGDTVDAGYPVPDKLVALSFDDGPNAMLTPAVLDKLEAHHVSASFFLIGQNINAGAQAVLDRAASLGCEFENHSSGYGALTGLTAEAIETAVSSTTAAIEQFTGTSPVFFRPPNLAIDDLMREVIDYPLAGGLVGGDFPVEFGGRPTVEDVTNTVLNGVQDGTIILLHDYQPQLNPQPTPPALDIIIPELKERGYEIVTVRQLFARRGVDPNSQQDMLWTRVPPAP